MARRRQPSRSLVGGLLLLAIISAAGLAAPWLTGDPSRIDLQQVLAPPSIEHWLGTDGLGRDLAARVIHGARISLAVGLLSAFLALLAGIPLGAAAGYLRGSVDGVISRIIEAVLCFPTLLLLLALLAAGPAWLRRLPDVVQLAAVIALTAWIPIARYLRGEFLRLTGSDLVAAARASGAGHLRIVFRHLLPAALAPVLVTTAFTVAGAITLEAAISFIGLGIQPPTPSWGSLLTEARHHVDKAWWLALFPGSALFLTVLACNLAGEGLRDWLDPEKTP
ncbi:MAG: ABC transporter permease [Acidobacteria bacterium]|uniref:ABC transporter permease n=1 Tax=Candidatus Polarisedimenticola svalbardensis TaxID=2886004 RepID=A0A8J6Y7I9_9BACT|nr:ABC transporter permease [Candidatus Polarisedimenticola svalbardensis]